MQKDTFGRSRHIPSTLLHSSTLSHYQVSGQ
jgi:hypothetical protein